ncbi:MAG: endonuclease/exonuclease/phosphatase family protein [Treponema sp.]|jgi:endonuclease/exonuclease/phosphatase family metal-dependent hydrolase|nr:endonuclease/exonuclease/phosphatase family protein [Treponema sp.]
MKKLFFFCSAALLWGCKILPENAASLSVSESADVFSAAVWNLQALFDGEESGGEYDEYLASAGWTAEKFKARVNAISDALLSLNAAPPDLIGLVEVENPGVLEALAKNSLAKYGYKWTGFAGMPGSSLGLGVLSRRPLKEMKVHSLTSGTATIPRPVLEVRVEAGEKPLVFFICHWKSKLGGDDATEALRRAAAKVLARRIGELAAEDPALPVIVMGDLNENHDEFYRRGSAVVTALLPDEPEAAAIAAAASAGGAGSAGDYLVISGRRQTRAAYFDAPALYSPWWDGELTRGSYFYSGNWETIDHLLLNAALFDGADWEFASCAAGADAPFTGQNGRPAAYNPRSGLGLSDHLPLNLLLKRE